MAIKIGYQGMVGSNNEEAALDMANKMGFTEVEYVPLIHSKGVVDALEEGTIDYGVMAIYNVMAGDVEETITACKGLPYRIITMSHLAIHHCLFVKNASVLSTQITEIASHIHALSQCKEYMQTSYGTAVQKEIEDTAIGARYLAEGTLPETTAILCRKNAGDAFGLHMLEENVEDRKDNYTMFMMIQA